MVNKRCIYDWRWATVPSLLRCLGPAARLSLLVERKCDKLTHNTIPLPCAVYLNVQPSSSSNGVSVCQLHDRNKSGEPDASEGRGNAEARDFVVDMWFGLVTAFRLVLIAPTDGQAELTWVGGTYRDKCPESKIEPGHGHGHPSQY